MPTSKPKPKAVSATRKSGRHGKRLRRTGALAQSKPPATSRTAIRRSAASKPAPSAPSKQAAVLAMLSKPNGTTIDAITKTTGWQPHSVRGFLAGVVKRKLKLNLVSEKIDKNRIYRIAEAGRCHNDG